jgi:hypothetical protein
MERRRSSIPELVPVMSAVTMENTAREASAES